MEDKPPDVGTDWLAVVGRALALMCLAEADLRDKDLVSQANFLKRLGLDRTEAAKVLATTAETIRVGQHRAKKAGKKHGKRAKGSSAQV